MNRNYLIPTGVALAIALTRVTAGAQSTPHLHLTDRWHECSFQLDASLTKPGWQQFTAEAGLVTYFRPLADARPLGRGKVEASILQWKTGIDDSDAAWNDTFVHPDSTHVLFEGDGLKFPGLTARVGVTDKTDLGVYFTKSPGANYGFYGFQAQRALIGGATSKWAASARLSFVSLYGPEDVDFRAAGFDIITSRTMTLNRWATVSPYVNLSSYAATAHEKSTVVSLGDTFETGSQASFGAALQLARARLGAEYNVARVPSLSIKIGVGF